MNGYRFNIYNGFVSWGRVRDGRPPSQRREPYLPIDPLEARARRVHNTIKKVLMRLIPQPLWFVTVTMPNEPRFRELTDVTPAETNALLALLKRAYREEFPSGYLFWDIEFSYENGVHFHFGCYPGERIDQDGVKDWFRNKWCRICGNYAQDIVDVKVFNRDKGSNFHANYLTKRKKMYRRMLLIDNFGVLNTFGVIGRENVRLENPRKRTLSEEQKTYVIEVVIEHSYQKIKTMKRSWEFMEPDLIDMIDDELYQIEQVKSGYGLHYLDDELREKLELAFDEVAKL